MSSMAHKGRAASGGFGLSVSQRQHLTMAARPVVRARHANAGARAAAVGNEGKARMTVPPCGLIAQVQLIGLDIAAPAHLPRSPP